MTLTELDRFFTGKTILVTGGTGSFGNEIVKQLLTFAPQSVRIFSRDEKKQYDMQNKLRDSNKIEFVLGNVRDLASLQEAMMGVDIVYHAAALKQVPNCEFNPYEAVKTNILGSENVRQAAISSGVGVVVSVSTDKAVKPVNVMGMTKAVQERLLLNPVNGNHTTRFICVRYGNVVGSRGSVIPFFATRIREGKTLPVTHPEMTRFLLTLSQAVDLVFKATVEGESGQLFVRKMPACRILDLAYTMARVIAEDDDYPVELVGVRPGEKIHEVLVSEEEMLRAVETEQHYVIYPYGRLERPQLIRDITEYTSCNTDMMNEEELATLLRLEGWL
jgi:UDP-N-acetylglucosamine 4,6-dehydratase/5-epimerase